MRQEEQQYFLMFESLDDIKDNIRKYIQMHPEVTYPELCHRFHIPRLPPKSRTEVDEYICQLQN